MSIKPNKQAIVATTAMCAFLGAALILAAGYDFNWGR